MEPATETTPRARKAHIRWICATLALSVAAFCLFAAPTAYIDPLFHYHAPLDQYQYPITNERYQNDGITRHFSYDGIITGTSVTENFKTSEADALFDATFIKVPFAGGRHKEVNDNLRRAYESGHEIKYIIRGLDSELLIQDKDAYKEDYQYPTYLYNDNPFDDVNYLLNKTILFDYTMRVVDYTKAGNRTTSFDDYASWSDQFEYGADIVLAPYAFAEEEPPEDPLTEEDRRMIQENLQQNVIDLALEHPETTFYLFFSPFSIVDWGRQYNLGRVERQVDAEQVAIEALLQVPNIRLYSFNNNFDLICDLSNYKDYEHYGDWINSWILEQLCGDEYRLTRDNYQAYMDAIRQFYTTFDYAALTPDN